MLLLALAGAPAAGAQQTGDLHSPAALAITVQQLQGCLGSLPGGDRRLLLRRFGTSGKPAATQASVAAQLHTTTAAVAAAEIRAVRRLANAHRQRHCGEAAQRPTTPSVRTPTAPGQTAIHAAAAPATTGAGTVAAVPGNQTSWTKPSVLIALAITGVCLLLLGFELRRQLRGAIRGGPGR